MKTEELTRLRNNIRSSISTNLEEYGGYYGYGHSPDPYFFGDDFVFPIYGEQPPKKKSKLKRALKTIGIATAVGGAGLIGAYHLSPEFKKKFNRWKEAALKSPSKQAEIVQKVTGKDISKESKETREQVFKGLDTFINQEVTPPNAPKATAQNNQGLGKAAMPPEAVEPASTDKASTELRHQTVLNAFKGLKATSKIAKSTLNAPKSERVSLGIGAPPKKASPKPKSVKTKIQTSGTKQLGLSQEPEISIGTNQSDTAPEVVVPSSATYARKVNLITNQKRLDVARRAREARIALQVKNKKARFSKEAEQSARNRFAAAEKEASSGTVVDLSPGLRKPSTFSKLQAKAEKLQVSPPESVLPYDPKKYREFGDWFKARNAIFAKQDKGRKQRQKSLRGGTYPVAPKSSVVVRKPILDRTQYELDRIRDEMEKPLPRTDAPDRPRKIKRIHWSKAKRINDPTRKIIAIPTSDAEDEFARFSKVLVEPTYNPKAVKVSEEVVGYTTSPVMQGGIGRKLVDPYRGEKVSYNEYLHPPTDEEAKVRFEGDALLFSKNFSGGLDFSDALSQAKKRGNDLVLDQDALKLVSDKLGLSGLPPVFFPKSEERETLRLRELYKRVTARTYLSSLEILKDRQISAAYYKKNVLENLARFFDEREIHPSTYPAHTEHLTRALTELHRMSSKLGQAQVIRTAKRQGKDLNDVKDLLIKRKKRLENWVEDLTTSLLSKSTGKTYPSNPKSLVKELNQKAKESVFSAVRDHIGDSMAEGLQKFADKDGKLPDTLKPIQIESLKEFLATKNITPKLNSGRPLSLDAIKQAISSSYRMETEEDVKNVANEFGSALKLRGVLPYGREKLSPEKYFAKAGLTGEEAQLRKRAYEVQITKKKLLGKNAYVKPPADTPEFIRIENGKVLYRSSDKESKTQFSKIVKEKFGNDFFKQKKSFTDDDVTELNQTLQDLGYTGKLISQPGKGETASSNDVYNEFVNLVRSADVLDVRDSVVGSGKYSKRFADALSEGISAQMAREVESSERQFMELPLEERILGQEPTKQILRQVFKKNQLSENDKLAVELASKRLREIQQRRGVAKTITQDLLNDIKRQPDTPGHLRGVGIWEYTPSPESRPLPSSISGLLKDRGGIFDEDGVEEANKRFAKQGYGFRLELKPGQKTLSETDVEDLWKGSIRALRPYAADDWFNFSYELDGREFGSVRERSEVSQKAADLLKEMLGNPLNTVVVQEDERGKVKKFSYPRFMYSQMKKKEAEAKIIKSKIRQMYVRSGLSEKNDWFQFPFTARNKELQDEMDQIKQEIIDNKWVVTPDHADRLNSVFRKSNKNYRVTVPKNGTIKWKEMTEQFGTTKLLQDISSMEYDRNDAHDVRIYSGVMRAAEEFHEVLGKPTPDELNKIAMSGNWFDPITGLRGTKKAYDSLSFEKGQRNQIQLAWMEQKIRDLYSSAPKSGELSQLRADDSEESEARLKKIISSKARIKKALLRQYEVAMAEASGRKQQLNAMRGYVVGYEWFQQLTDGQQERIRSTMTGMNAWPPAVRAWARKEEAGISKLRLPDTVKQFFESEYAAALKREYPTKPQSWIEDRVSTKLKKLEKSTLRIRELKRNVMSQIKGTPLAIPIVSGFDIPVEEREEAAIFNLIGNTLAERHKVPLEELAERAPLNRSKVDKALDKKVVENTLKALEKGRASVEARQAKIQEDLKAATNHYGMVRSSPLLQLYSEPTSEADKQFTRAPEGVFDVWKDWQMDNLLYPESQMRYAQRMEDPEERHKEILRKWRKFSHALHSVGAAEPAVSGGAKVYSKKLSATDPFSKKAQPQISSSLQITHFPDALFQVIQNPDAELDLEKIPETPVSDAVVRKLNHNLGSTIWQKPLRVRQKSGDPHTLRSLALEVHHKVQGAVSGGYQYSDAAIRTLRASSGVEETPVYNLKDVDKVLEKFNPVKDRDERLFKLLANPRTVKNLKKAYGDETKFLSVFSSRPGVFRHDPLYGMPNSERAKYQQDVMKALDHIEAVRNKIGTKSSAGRVYTASDALSELLVAKAQGEKYSPRALELITSRYRSGLTTQEKLEAFVKDPLALIELDSQIENAHKKNTPFTNQLRRLAFASRPEHGVTVSLDDSESYLRSRLAHLKSNMSTNREAMRFLSNLEDRLNKDGPHEVYAEMLGYINSADAPADSFGNALTGIVSTLKKVEAKKIMNLNPDEYASGQRTYSDELGYGATSSDPESIMAKDLDHDPIYQEYGPGQEQFYESVKTKIFRFVPRTSGLMLECAKNKIQKSLRFLN